MSKSKLAAVIAGGVAAAGVAFVISEIRLRSAPPLTRPVCMSTTTCTGRVMSRPPSANT